MQIRLTVDLIPETPGEIGTMLMVDPEVYQMDARPALFKAAQQLGWLAGLAMGHRFELEYRIRHVIPHIDEKAEPVSAPLILKVD